MSWRVVGYRVNRNIPNERPPGRVYVIADYSEAGFYRPLSQWLPLVEECLADAQESHEGIVWVPSEECFELVGAETDRVFDVYLRPVTA